MRQAFEHQVPTTLSMNTTAKVSKLSELIGITDKVCTDLSDENSHNIKVGMATVPVYDQVAETVVPSVFVPLNCTMQDCGRPLDVSVVIAQPRYVEI